MKTYEIELTNGKIYEVDVDDVGSKPQTKVDEEKPPLDAMGAIKRGVSSALSPTPAQLSLGGNPALRFAQTTATDLYGQARGNLQDMVPQNVNRFLGAGASSAIPGGLLLPSRAKEAVGREVAGAGIDVLAGMVGGGLSSVATALKTPRSLRNATYGELDFLNKVRGAFVKAKQSAADEFGDQLDSLANKSPDVSVNISSVLEELRQDISIEPKLKSVVNRVPALKKLLNSNESTGELSLKESQKIINDLQSKVSQSKLRGMNVRPDDLPVIDAIHNIRAAQLEAFPEMAGARSKYGQVLGDYGLVKNRIRPGNLQNSLRRGFGDAEIEAAVKRLLPKDILKQVSGRLGWGVGGYRGVKNLGGLLGKIIGTSALGGAAAVGYNLVKE